MSFLLDTNVLSAHLRRPAGLQHRFAQHSGRLFTPALCLGELYVWAFNHASAGRVLGAIQKMLHDEVSVIDFDSDAAETFGRTRVELRRRGISTDAVDLMIAAVALSYDLTLVTHNTRDYQAIPGLRLDDWIAP